jgi:hypothetical protein
VEDAHAETLVHPGPTIADRQEEGTHADRANPQVRTSVGTGIDSVLAT